VEAAGTELQELRKELFPRGINEAQRQLLEARFFGDLRSGGTLFWLRYRAQLELRRLSAN
jgi:hypothetical protein